MTELEEAQEKAKQLPHVKGYKILCALPTIENKFDSGILSNVLFVVSLGDMAYADKNRFPTGPWCKPGDLVITRANTGTRLKIHDREFRIINDDSVEAVVEDPRGIQRA
ncbi:MAG: hypothetical protein EBZ09_12815 [Betaproteobacteria bacterium]|nr:hypothetical protein [Betaproteobacteria bacterium]